MYAPQIEALGVLISSSLLCLFVFLKKYEIPILENGNPFGTYTPSDINPRCGYHYVPANTEYRVGFNILSMFTPLRFQEHFPQNSQNLNHRF
jgi:hypothetical protein